MSRKTFPWYSLRQRASANRSQVAFDLLLALAAYAALASVLALAASDLRDRAVEAGELQAGVQRAALECVLTRDLARSGGNSRVQKWEWLNSSCGEEVFSNDWIRSRKEPAA